MILIGTPCYNGTVTVHYMQSVIALIETMSAEGVPLDFLTPSHESLITRARNFVANKFLRQPLYTHLLFIDSDIAFPPDALPRFLRSGKDVVCGVYPVKHLDIGKLRRLSPTLSDDEAEAASLGYTVKFRPGCRVDDQGFVSVEYGPAGFMLIKREVLEKLAEAYPELRYGGAYVNNSSPDQMNFAFFDTSIDQKTLEYLPEDYAFCRRWTSLGGEVHADVNSRFTHVGSRDYSGDFPAFLAHLRD
jgi:hypothetical protein